MPFLTALLSLAALLFMTRGVVASAVLEHSAWPTANYAVIQSIRSCDSCDWQIESVTAMPNMPGLDKSYCEQMARLSNSAQQIECVEVTVQNRDRLSKLGVQLRNESCRRYPDGC